MSALSPLPALSSRSFEIVDQLETGVAVLDREDVLTYANPAFCELFAVSPSRSRSLPLAALSHGERQAFLFAAHMCRSTVTDSVVLVDSPETMMDPTHLPRFVRGLADIATSNQFIIATSHHSLVRELASDSVHIDLKGIS